MARLEVVAPIGHRRRRLRAVVAFVLLAVGLIGCSSSANGRHALAAVESDLRSAAIAMERELTEHRAYPAGVDTLLGDLLAGFSAEQGAEVLLVWSSENAFCLEATKGDVIAWYDATDGGITDTSCR